MASEELVTVKKYRVFNALLDKWQRYSFWTKASDVELNDGTNVESAISMLNLSLEGVDLESKFNLPIQTTTFPSDGSILVTYADSSTLRTVFNSDGSISYIYTKGTEVTERKIVFNSDGSISVVDVPQTQGGE